MRAAAGRQRDVREADLSELLPKKAAINRVVQRRDRGNLMLQISYNAPHTQMGTLLPLLTCQIASSLLRQAFA